MKKILITGFSGFVGRHFIKYLYENHIEMDIYGVDIKQPTFDCQEFADTLRINYKILDLMDISALREFFNEFTPDYILHLASFSSVAYSWKNPSESFTNNTNIFLNLISVVKEFNKKCRILSVGSSEEYGNVTMDDIPLSEDKTLKPISPYAVARVSQEMLSQVFVESYHMDIVLTRSFNHIGPWQDERFVVPSFIARIVQLKKEGKREGSIETGDISVIRDFVDVRDVVRAYYLLLLHGRNGEIYNICSGEGISLKEVIDKIAKQVNIKVLSRINPQFVRPNDNKIIIGNHNKIVQELHWKPEIPIDKTLKDMIDMQYMKV